MLYRIDLLGSVTGDGSAGIERSECRHLCSRQVVRIRASRMERASGRRVRRVGHRARQDDPRTAGREVDLRHRGKQRERVRVGRAGEELLGRAVFDDAPEVEHCRLLAQLLDHGRVVRDQHVREPAFPAERRYQLEDARLDRDVERARRLVQHEHLGLRTALARSPPAASALPRAGADTARPSRVRGRPRRGAR